MTQIRRLDTATDAAWDRFVDGCGDASFFHRAKWRDVIQRAFKHKPHYLYAENNQQITAILPLFHVRSLLFGNSLISMPFCVYGGAVGSNEEDRQLLLQEACRLAEELQVDYLEVRNDQKMETDWPGKDLYVTFRKEISGDSEENMLAIPRKQRAMVRKGIKGGLSSHIDHQVDEFYACYSESVRNLGTPVFSRKYFKILKEVFQDECEILIVTHEKQAVAGVMSFYFKDQVLPYYGGGKMAARNLYANDFMYWQVMETAREKGVKVFDYGRSKVDSGSYRFKKHWGFEPTPLAYSYHLVKSKEIPNISPNNAKYRYFVDAWRRMPLALSNRIGPWLARQLG